MLAEITRLEFTIYGMSMYAIGTLSTLAILLGPPRRKKK